MATVDYLHHHKEFSELIRHKIKRFPKPDLQIPIKDNQAFLVDKAEIRNSFKSRYQKTSALYYKGQPDLDEVLLNIKNYLHKL